MARTGRPKAELVLTDDECDTSTRWVRRRTSSQALALRCRIVLECSTRVEQGRCRSARCRGAHRESVEGPLRAGQAGGLTDEPHPGAPRKITDEQVEEVIVRTLESTPKDATHWSTRSMSEQVGLSQTAVARIWRTFGLKPHLVGTFRLSKDPQFIEKGRDVVGLYLAPPEHALVLCVDEKTQIQALDRSAPVLPMMPGMPERGREQPGHVIERGFARRVRHRRAHGAHPGVAGDVHDAAAPGRICAAPEVPPCSAPIARSGSPPAVAASQRVSPRPGRRAGSAS